MCGRFALNVTDVEIRQHFGLDELEAWQPRYNIAPSLDVPVIYQGAAGRAGQRMHWGLVPHWSKGPDNRYSMINARAETVAVKPAYRDPFKRSRCLVPATGYYEWKKGADGKQPYYLRPKGATLFALAGLWDEWQGEGGSIRSFTLITTDANPQSAQVHDRMPVIIDPTRYDTWLMEENPDTLQAIMRPWAAELELWPVSTAVNNARHESPELIQPLT